MGCLRPLHEAGEAVGLLSSGFGPKGHDTHNAPLFLRLKGYALLVGEKYCVSTLSMENCRLLMRICSNAFVTLMSLKTHYIFNPFF